MEVTIFADLSAWGVGLDVGKTRYDPYRFYFGLTVFCFNLVIWFWKK